MLRAALSACHRADAPWDVALGLLEAGKGRCQHWFTTCLLPSHETGVCEDVGLGQCLV